MHVTLKYQNLWPILRIKVNFAHLSHILVSHAVAEDEVLLLLSDLAQHITDPAGSQISGLDPTTTTTSGMVKIYIGYHCFEPGKMAH